MIGGAGDDRMLGGGNADVMTGRTGADVFLYTGWRDSRAGEGRAGVRADVISDFTSGVDRINLAALDVAIRCRRGIRP